MAKMYPLTVWNTLTAQYEEIVVSQEIYDEYRRSEWRINKSNDKHSVNETPFSALIGSDDGKIENFHEFLSDDENPEKLIERKELQKALHRAVASLDKADQELIRAIFFEGMSEREYAKRIGVSQVTIHRKKQRILRDLKKFMV